jgi:hypothetical protein
MDRRPYSSNAPMKRILLNATFALLMAFPVGVWAAAVNLERVPERGMQPQVAVGENGTVHLIYLTGDPKSADVRYSHRLADSKEWSAPITVNSQKGSAIAIGTIRGAQLALGRNGIVHVCWNGSSLAEPKPKFGGSPLLYARLDQAKGSFEAQRDLMGTTHNLDGGASLAADKNGSVFVVWHGSPGDIKGGEDKRAVYLAPSGDDGSTFASERAINPEGSGACGCCGVKAFAQDNGDLFVLFRTARDMTERAMQVLHSKDHGASFQPELNHPWEAKQCPMSSSAFASGEAGTFAAWETAGQVFAAKLGNARQAAEPISPKKGAKHPALAENKTGDWIVTWTEGTGWERGGALAWKLNHKDGKTELGRQEGVPKWSYAAAYAAPNGSFTVLY